MAYLIDISRPEFALELVKALPEEYAVKAGEVIEAEPRVDAVPVVRCKDCRFSRKRNLENPKEAIFSARCIWCKIRSDAVFPDDYCSDGERREAAENG